jgi:YD repeat-containing protein
MKKTTFLLFLLISTYGIFAQENFEAKDKERISKNKIKIQTEWSYDYVNGTPSTNGYKSSQTNFDTYGNILQKINFKANGDTASIILYTYDKNQNRTSFSRFKGNKKELSYNQQLIYNAQSKKIGESGFDGSSRFLNIFLYDLSGRLSEIRYTTDKIQTEKRVFKHFGNKIEMNILNPTGMILSKEITTYDTDKNIIEEVKYIQDNPSQKSNYQYNNAGKKTEESKVSFGNLSYRRKYSYDLKYNLVQIIEFTAEEKSFTASEYKYDERGNVIEERWTKDTASGYSKKTHKYDISDLLTETDSYSASYNFSVLYKYTYQKY